MSTRNRKKNSLTSQVRRAYRKDELASILTLPEEDFGSAFKMETVGCDIQVPAGTKSWRRGRCRDNSYYHFRDNGSTVLAVAHLDTVVDPDRRAPRFRNTQSGPYVVSGALDDRLGAYVILGLLPKLGVSCDQLLTVGEEDGESTAEFFKPDKDYDWIIEFDRSGTDVVMYQFEDEPCRKLVEASGARMGKGSFSDIAYMEHLDVKAFNWGAGYRGDYHSERGYAYLSDTFAMTAKYLRFHEQNAGSTLLHEQDLRWYEDGETLECVRCLQPISIEDNICPECDSCQFCYLEDGTCMCYTRHALSGRPVGELLLQSD